MNDTRYRLKAALDLLNTVPYLCKNKSNPSDVAKWFAILLHCTDFFNLCEVKHLFSSISGVSPSAHSTWRS